jgi:hypothetical protein
MLSIFSIWGYMFSGNPDVIEENWKDSYQLTRNSQAIEDYLVAHRIHKRKHEFLTHKVADHFAELVPKYISEVIKILPAQGQRVMGFVMHMALVGTTKTEK